MFTLRYQINGKGRSEDENDLGLAGNDSIFNNDDNRSVEIFFQKLISVWERLFGTSE